MESNDRMEIHVIKDGSGAVGFEAYGGTPEQFTEYRSAFERYQKVHGRTMFETVHFNPTVPQEGA